MKSFKKHRDFGFWDQNIRLSKLSQLGDLLVKAVVRLMIMY